MQSLVGVLVAALLFVSYIPLTVNSQTSEKASIRLASAPIKKKEPIVSANVETERLYKEMNLAGILKFEAFEQALQGYNSLNPANKNILSIIDFSLPSTDKRLVILDMQNHKVLFHTIVSHGRNSGEKYAVSFSNRHGSYQSSLGFYTTANTYQGGNGYSLVLNGLEKGINDQAKARAVVIHGADYVSNDIIQNTGRLGRSYGCPALPRQLTKPIINSIKNGTLLYIYAKNKEYLAQTKIINTNTSNTMLAQHDMLENDDLKNLN